MKDKMLAVLRMVAEEATNTPTTDAHLTFAYDSISAETVLAVRSVIKEAEAAE